MCHGGFIYTLARLFYLRQPTSNLQTCLNSLEFCTYTLFHLHIGILSYLIKGSRPKGDWQTKTHETNITGEIHLTLHEIKSCQQTTKLLMLLQIYHLSYHSWMILRDVMCFYEFPLPLHFHFSIPLLSLSSKCALNDIAFSTLKVDLQRSHDTRETTFAVLEKANIRRADGPTFPTT